MTADTIEPTLDLQRRAATTPDSAGHHRVRAAIASGAVGAAIVAAVGFTAFTMVIWPLDPRIAAGRLAGDAVVILIILTVVAGILRAAEDRGRRRADQHTEQLRRDLAATSDEFVHLRAHISALTVSAVTDVKREISRVLEEPTRQLAAQAARLKALADGTSLDPNDPALLPGQRRNSHHYLSATVVDGGRIDAVIDNQQKLTDAVTTLAGYLVEFGGELGRVRVIAEQAVQRGAAGAPRRRRQRNGRPRNGLSDAELRGYLTGVYDRERGNEGPQ